VRQPPDANVVATLNGHLRSVFSLKFSPTGNVLLSAGNDGNVNVWDTRMWSTLKVLNHENNEALCCEMTVDGN
jgi:WD40 repeat protein